MTRIVSYNILAGGYSQLEGNTRRTQQLIKIIRSAQPDIVGVVEATHPGIKQHPQVVEEVAEELGMQLITGAEPVYRGDYQLALMTRLPVVYTKIHARPGIIGRAPLEVCVEEANGQKLTAIVIHLRTAFNQGRAGGHIRVREASEIVTLLKPLRLQKTPHVLMGDFNSLGPGDPFKAHFLLKYLDQLDKKYKRRNEELADGNPHIDGVVPPQLRFMKPLLLAIPRSKVLSTLFDSAASLYAPRKAIRIVRDAGYIDCYRKIHPDEWGFTCPAAAPAGRIDYIFASHDLTDRLEVCHPITEGEGISGGEASDHLALAAEFSPGIKLIEPELTTDSTTVR